MNPLQFRNSSVVKKESGKTAAVFANNSSNKRTISSQEVLSQNQFRFETKALRTAPLPTGPAAKKKNTTITRAGPPSQTTSGKPNSGNKRGAAILNRKRAGQRAPTAIRTALRNFRLGAASLWSSDAAVSSPSGHFLFLSSGKSMKPIRPALLTAAAAKPNMTVQCIPPKSPEWVIPKRSSPQQTRCRQRNRTANGTGFRRFCPA